MKETFKVGNKTTRRFKIDASKQFPLLEGILMSMQRQGMIRDIERTCKDYILEHADANEDSVGTLVNISHVGATLLGMLLKFQYY